MEKKYPPPPPTLPFNPEMAEIASFHHRTEEYKKHLEKLRLFFWVALIVLSALIYWHGETDRYRHVKDNIFVDTKTGLIYNHLGEQVK